MADKPIRATLIVSLELTPQHGIETTQDARRHLADTLFSLANMVARTNDLTFKKKVQDADGRETFGTVELDIAGGA